MTAIFAYSGADLPMAVMRYPERFIRKLDCPRAIKPILMRAIELDPDDRYEDAASFCAALRSPPAPMSALTERERQVVSYAVLGHPNKFIGYELHMSVSTVRVLVARAAAKLGVRSRAELIKVVGHSGLAHD